MSLHQARRASAKRTPLLTIASIGFVLLATGTVRARADMREAIKRALPATVCVEQRDASGSAANELTMATGALVSADGLVVTLIQHQGGDKFRVTLSDGRETQEREAKLLVDDRRTGLKLVKIDAANLPFLTTDAQAPPIGEDVVATYSLGLKQRAVARGIVSAVDRQLDESSDDLLQLDINVGPMSAGGPIVDDEGRLRGIIALTKEDGGHSVTFALPASKLQALLQAPRGNSPTVIRRARLGVQHDESEAKVVAHPIKEGAAVAAGLREGDEMLALDDVKLKRFSDLNRAMSQHAAGDKVRLTLRRDGKDQTIDVTLAPAPEDKDQAAAKRSALDAVVDLKLNVVKPGQVYVTQDNGNLTVLEDLKAQKLKLEGNQLIFTTTVGTPAAKQAQEGGGHVLTPSIRVERSDVDKKLEQIGRDVLTLRQQMESLTDEMRRLQKQLANDAAHRSGK